MKRTCMMIVMKRILVPTQVVVGACAIASGAHAQALADIECTTPAPQHCGETCTAELLADRGNAIEPETGREFFLDYPCDLAPDEKVLFILSLHGAGSIGNWQRHYFPALDYKDEYRLVIATPTAAGSGSIGPAPVRMWTPDTDDEYLENVVSLVLDRFGRENIGAFWLAGHSQGGMTSNRIVCTDFFRDKVDGWLSLSGGRIGRAEVAPDFFGPDGPPAALASGDPNAPRPGAGVMPDCDISYIFTSGEHEIVALPETSPIAEMYRCGARERRSDIVDATKGYVSASTPGRGASWGREARPGTARVFVYPDCDGGRIVADVLRMDKGHTEGLEPGVTKALIELMAAAPGGKVAAQGRPDLTGLYRSAQQQGGPGADVEPPFTAEGRRKVAEFEALLEEGVTAGQFCLSYGMPGIAARPVYPVEIIERPDFVTIIYELHQQIRHVYLNLDAVPDDVFPTRNGFSLGRWEDDTLVVETTDLIEWLERYPHSDEARIVERYSVSESDEGKKLDVDITVIDPSFYTEPLRISHGMIEIEGARLLDYDCTEPEWLEYLERRSAELADGA